MGSFDKHTRIIFLILSIGLVSSAPADGSLDCKNIESDDARLKCYDEGSERVIAKNPESLSSVADQEMPAPLTNPSMISTTPAATPEQKFGQSADEMTAIIAELSGDEEVNETIAIVTSARQDGYGRIIMSLDNQQRWRQIRKERFEVKVGDEIIIRKAVLGSFSMQRRSGGRKTKVRRVN